MPSFGSLLPVLTRLQQFDRAITVRELAGILSVHPLTIYRACKNGLPHFRIFSAVRFCPATVAGYLRDHELKAAPLPKKRRVQ